MKDRAYAKINLSLDVFNVREDGYHDISSIMLPIDFYDELNIHRAHEDSFSCNRRFIRWGPHNSIYKMIEVMRERYGIKDHFAISLNKCVPIQAGLGGGTADAAGTLRILQDMYHLEMSKEEIIDVCLKVGADVPFNYFNVPAVVSGIGDVIDPIDLKKTYYILIVKPSAGVSTKEAYNTLNMGTCAHPDIEELKKILEEGRDFKGLLGNSLEEPALRLNPQIREIEDLLKSYEKGEVLMSGSGSAVFCISENNEDIRALYQKIKQGPYYVRFTKTLSVK